MRRFLIAAALLALLPPAVAQQAPPPPKLEPIPEPPPQAIAIDAQSAAELGVTLQPGDRAERYVVDGQQFIRVITSSGTEYYLVEALPGAGPFAGAQPHDAGVRVPMWRVWEW